MRVAVRDGGELQGRLLTVRVAYLGIVYARQVVILLPRNHERCKISRVDGEEDHSKESPDTGHEPGSQASRTVHLHGCLEEYGPYQPVGAEQGEFVLMGCRGFLFTT